MMDDPQMTFVFPASAANVPGSVLTLSPDPRTLDFRGWMRKPGLSSNDNARVSSNELASLRALISYVAQHSKLSEYQLEQKLSDHFLAANIRLISSNQFDDALRFLVDRVDD